MRLVIGQIFVRLSVPLWVVLPIVTAVLIALVLFHAANTLADSITITSFVQHQQVFMNKQLKGMLRNLLMTKEMRWRSQERSLHELYDPLIAEVKGDEREMLHQELNSQLWEIYRERREDGDFKLIRRAHRYDIPIPPKREEDGFWEEWERGYWLLTDRGIHHLLKEIREEQQARLGLVKGKLDLIAPFITGMVGLIGALIGLISVFGK
jgi:hypothetical protein